MKKKIYLDYAATTPVDSRVLNAMRPFWHEKFGNTMSLHSFGREAEAALEKTKKTIADIIGAETSEIIFTSSATESNNTILKGVSAKHIIVSAIEHPCIMKSAKYLKKQGVKITKIPVDKYGMVNPKDIEKAITKDTSLVSIIHASNEIGTIQPITEIGRICKRKSILFHTDAAQTFGKISIDVKKANIDLLTASSHKIYGPKGAALLYIKNGLKLNPLLHGGGQENGFRSSTVNVPAVVGFAKAAEIAQKEIPKESKRLIGLKNKLIKEVLEIEKVKLNGNIKNALPNIINFSFLGIEGESLVLELDLKGFAVSTGSACSSLSLEPSYVLLAIGSKPEKAHGSLRVSLGRQTTEKEIDSFVKALFPIVKKLRKISPFK